MNIRLRRVTANLLVLMVSTIVVLLAIELVLRVVIRDRQVLVSQRLSGLDIMHDGTYLPWVLRPGASSRHLSPYGEFDYEFSINAVGLRDREVSLEKPEGTFRILTLGDSFTVGWAVDLEHTYTKVLERILNSGGAASEEGGRAAYRNYEVLNCGWASWNTTDGAYVFLRHRIEDFDPDLVLLGFFLNDPAELWPHQWRPRGAALPDTIAAPKGRIPGRPGRRNALSKIRSFLGRKSYLYNVARERWTGLLRRAAWGEDLYTLEDAIEGHEYPATALVLFTDAYPQEIERRMELTDRLLEAADDICRSHGARFAVAVIPADFQLLPRKKEKYCILPVVFHDRRYVDDKAQEQLTAMCEENGIPALDLLPVFRSRGSEDCYFRKDPHWTSKGHALAAEAIASFLQDNELLD